MSTAQNAMPIMIPTAIVSERVLLFVANAKNSTASDYQIATIHCHQETTPNALTKLSDGSIKPDVILLVNPDEDYHALINEVQGLHIPLVYYTPKFDQASIDIAVNLGVDDYLYGSINEDFIRHIDVLKKIKLFKSNFKNDGPPSGAPVFPINMLPSRKMWRLKRTSDIFVALFSLIVLSPIMALVALVIKIESKGPVFYISKRSGSGYKVFDFYKFRTMRQGSEEELKNLKDSNQYGSEKAIFFKIKNDPRVTRIGQFLRSTSLDELPQLFNVLKGDMSLVGNRPLPLYEAELLTRDNMAARFLAPAGITGLWQVTKRGKENMSPEERIQLDIEYAMKNSFLFDMQIVLKTFVAVFQKEKV
jgi:lipopolysaccharide/colanic/teichoic acid biosynthesis glycosyltransferase